MTPEAGLLRYLIASLGSHAPPLPPFRPEGIRWNLFLSLVRRHRLGPLLHRETPAGFLLPASVREEWENEYNRQLARAVVAGGCLRTVLEGFSRRGIEPIVIKGAHLAELYYPHPALRPADDLDLLIRPAEAGAAEKLLERSGFRFRERSNTASKYLSPDTGVFLELHTGLQTENRRNPAFAIRIEDFRRNSLPARIAGAETRVLSPGINLLYLAAHLSHHGFSRLIWFYDLFLVIGKTAAEIDWDELAVRAREYSCAGQVYYPLIFTGFFFGKTAPVEALNRLAPRPMKRLITRPFINPGAVLEGRIPETGRGARRNRFLLNDSWPRALARGFGY